MIPHKEIKITFYPTGMEISVRPGTPLMDILHEYGIEFPCGGKGLCGSCKVKVLKGNIPLSRIHRSHLITVGVPEDMRLACMSAPDSDITIEIPQLETVILADNSRFEFEPLSGYGIAVDIGTTTLVAQLLDLKSGQVLNVATARNPQGKYGADIISRIEYALNKDHAEILKQLIRNKIGEMIHSLLKGYPVTIHKIILVGNTVMHHLFCGFDVTPLSFYPFESPNLGIQNFSPSELKWNLGTETEVTFMPSIGSFVGSDILAGIFATRLHLSDSCQVLIDLGTNGEIVIGNREKIICASTAAGPAFEGARITMGMTASTGAISSIVIDGGKFNFHTIGNVNPNGICGSGIIDAMAVFLDMNLMNDFGDIQSDDKQIYLDKQVFINQKDIREVQLAKSAINTGLEILYKQFGITRDHIDNLYIAGGFGNFINLSNALKIGLLDLAEKKIRKMGNTALIGAKMFLFINPGDIEEVLKITRHISLESDPGFQELFIQNMIFGNNEI
jgi:uncharacterized 2Fe-2S/4Fe-4S cluster protein (DUF4445 family)